MFTAVFHEPGMRVWSHWLHVVHHPHRSPTALPSSREFPGTIDLPNPFPARLPHQPLRKKRRPPSRILLPHPNLPVSDLFRSSPKRERPPARTALYPEASLTAGRVRPVSARSTINRGCSLLRLIMKDPRNNPCLPISWRPPQQALSKQAIRQTAEPEKC